jgi:hypothetical protein
MVALDPRTLKGTLRAGRAHRTIGAAQRPRERRVSAEEVHTVLVEIDWATQRFGLPGHA